MPSLSPSKLCRSSPIILKFLAEMSLQFNTGAAVVCIYRDTKGCSFRLAMADRHKDNSLGLGRGESTVNS